MSYIENILANNINLKWTYFDDIEKKMMRRTKAK